MSLKGKVVIVTGASSGIGAETCVHFARSGANVIAVGRNLTNLQQTVKASREANPAVKVIPVQADVTKESQKIVDETIAKFGKIDVLVNNAGILTTGDLLSIDVGQLDTVLDTNVRAVFVLTQLVAPYLIASKGNIVNVSSVAGVRSFPNVITYCVSKAALDQFTRCLSLELGPKGVRVNSVNPGVILTNIHKAAGMDDKEYLKYLEHSKTTHAMGRVGEPKEVAGAIVFLASDAASFINGNLLSIDGGKSVMCPR